MQIDRPLQCVVSDMTAFYVKGIYYELTLYMDLWNNEILAHALSSRRGDRMTYLSGLDDLIGLKKQYPQYEMILHSDQGAVYASMGGSSQKSLWIFMSQEKAPLNKRWQHILHFLILHGLHTP